MNTDIFLTCCKNNNLVQAKWLYENNLVNPTITDHTDDDIFGPIIYDTMIYAFEIACNNGSIDVAKWLLRLYPTIKHHKLPMETKYRHLEIIKMLIEEKVYPVEYFLDYDTYERSNDSIVPDLRPISIMNFIAEENLFDVYFWLYKEYGRETCHFHDYFISCCKYSKNLNFIEQLLRETEVTCREKYEGVINAVKHNALDIRDKILEMSTYNERMLLEDVAK